MIRKIAYRFFVLAFFPFIAATAHATDATFVRDNVALKTLFNGAYKICKNKSNGTAVDLYKSAGSAPFELGIGIYDVTGQIVFYRCHPTNSAYIIRSTLSLGEPLSAY